MDWSNMSGSSTTSVYNTASARYSMTTATTTIYTTTMTDSQPKPETDGPDDDGSAGVREPRRPRPTAPAGAMELAYEEVST